MATPAALLLISGGRALGGPVVRNGRKCCWGVSNAGQTRLERLAMERGATKKCSPKKCPACAFHLFGLQDSPYVSSASLG